MGTRTVTSRCACGKRVRRQVATSTPGVVTLSVQREFLSALGLPPVICALCSFRPPAATP